MSGISTFEGLIENGVGCEDALFNIFWLQFCILDFISLTSKRGKNFVLLSYLLEDVL